MIRVTVRCPIFPTEDKQIILDMLQSLFPFQSFELSKGPHAMYYFSILQNHSALDTLRTEIWNQRIIDSVKGNLISSDGVIGPTLKLDKQAAFMGRISLVSDDELPPLGALEIDIQYDSTDEFETFLNWFTPPTKDGKIQRN